MWAADYLVARFRRFYPGLYWSPEWRTRDRVIPIRLFFVLLERMANVSAAEELQQYFATLMAAAQVWAGEDAQGAIQRAIQKLRTMAYPDERPEPARSAIVVPSTLTPRERKE